jgi:hypothetical protein
MRKKTLWLLYGTWIATGGFLTSCTSDFEGQFPTENPTPVINAVLTDDSLINVELAWSRPPVSGAADASISGAIIELRENDNLLAPPQEKNPGHYLFQHHATAGSTYRIEVEIPGQERLKAETTIPERVKAVVEKEGNPQGDWVTEHFKLTTGSLTEKISGLWIIATSYNEDGLPIDQSPGLYCNSPLPDTFNQTYDASLPNGYVYEYDFFIRIDSKKLITENQQLWFAPFSLPKKNDIYIISASKDYDQYYKDVWAEKSWDPEIDLPFSYQPVFIHSNIENGYGIFAGCSIQRFRF